jgi:lipopolysaccharide export LptBFGC system permease protein LptF
MAKTLGDIFFGIKQPLYITLLIIVTIISFVAMFGLFIAAVWVAGDLRTKLALTAVITMGMGFVSLMAYIFISSLV